MIARSLLLVMERRIVSGGRDPERLRRVEDADIETETGGGVGMESTAKKRLWVGLEATRFAGSEAWSGAFGVEYAHH